MSDQLDYIFFIYGFAFLLLAALLWGRVQPARGRLPWGWLACFGLLHGMNEWLDMLAICLGDSPTFRMVRLAFLATSFIPLVEFGRSGLKAQGVGVPGRWIVVVLLALAGLGALAGMDLFNAACRYALGLTGAWLTAWVLVREAAKLDSGGRWPHLLAGVAFLGYGATAGMLVPEATFFPASVLNQEMFLGVFGFPVQLLRALCAAVAALGLWLDQPLPSGAADRNHVFRHWVMPALMLVMLTGGYWTTNWRGRLTDSEQRDRLLHQATHIAKTVGIDGVRSLSFTHADKANPAFQRLRAQMMAFAQAVQARSLYSMTVRNGSILFGPESLAEDDPFASPPGTVYEKPPGVIGSVLHSHLPQTYGPYTDEYGSFVSAFAPVTDPLTAEVSLVIGVDLEAQAWRAAISTERLHTIVFTLALALICLVGSAQLERRRVLSFKPSRWQSHLETWITAMVGLTLTFGVVQMVMKDEGRYRRTMFRQMADALANPVVGRALDVQNDIAPFLAHLLETDPAISRDLFRLVAQPYVSTHGIAGVGWAPRVSPGDSGGTERPSRSEEFEGFTIHDQDAEGRKHGADGRQTRYPLVLSEPHAESETLPGLDIAGDADRWPTAMQAILSGMPTATDVLQTASDSKHDVIDVYTPVYKQSLAAPDEPHGEAHGGLLGLTSVTVRLDGFLQEASSESLPYDRLAVLSVYQLEIGEGPKLLTVYPAAGFPHDPFAHAQDTESTAIIPLFVFGRTYAIVVSPGEAFLADRRLWSGWTVGLFGLFLTVALAAFVESIARRQIDLERLVKLRTAELLESKESYHRQFSDNSAVMLLIDPATGRIIDANQAASKFYGHSHDQWAGLTLTNIDMRPMESLQSALSSLTEQQCRNLEAQHRIANGAVRDVEVFYSLIVFRGQKVLHAIVHDITERRQSEKVMAARLRLVELAALHSLDEFLQATLDEMETLTGSQIGFYHFLEADQISLSLQSWSSSTLQHFCKAEGKGLHYRVDEAGVWVDCIGVRSPVIHNDYASLPHRKGLPHGHAEVKRELVVPVVRGEAITAIIGVGNKLLDYEEQDVEIMTRLADLSWDIVERKKTQEALQEAEERYRALFEGAGDAILIMRGECYMDCNQMALEMFGCDRKADVVGSAFWSFSSLQQPDGRDSREKGLEIIDAALGGTPQRFGWKHVRMDGTDFDTEVAVSKIESGDAVLLQALVRDVSERNQAEVERKSLEERLQRAEKMEALGTLAGGVAHDLNNVLGIVVGYSELLVEGLVKSPSERSQAMAILKAGQRAAAIVQDLLTLARRGVQGRKVLNLNTIVLECQGSPEVDRILSYHPSVQLRTDLDPTLLNISGSSVHLGKALLNLVSNAAEAMPRGGLITIATSNRYLDQPVSGYDEVREGDYAVLTVSDTGEGIPYNDLSRIFEPFYTKKVMGRSGTGLGLAVVWGTVKDHRGYINVESEVGKGSTFTLYIPITREEIAPEQSSTATAYYMGKGESILIVDDVKEQRELAATMLKRLDYHVATAASGEEAVKVLEQHAADLVVLDMIMEPGMDGLDTYRKILEVHPRQKAIIVSGFSETERVSQAQALGAGAYVRKPYVLEKLGLAVRNELDKPG